MSTVTAEATAADLLAELRELVNRYDGAETLDDVRQLADEVTAKLRRARGRISRLARQVAKTEAPAEPKPVAEPAPAPVESKPAAEPKPTQEAPAEVTHIRQIGSSRLNLCPTIGGEATYPGAATCAECAARLEAAERTPAVVPRPRPTPRHITTAHVLLAVISSWWSTGRARTQHWAQCAVRAIRSTGRRAARIATAVRTALARLGGAS